MSDTEVFNVDEFTQQLFSLVSAATQLANGLSTSDISFHRAIKSKASLQLDKVSSQLLHQACCIIKHQKPDVCNTLVNPLQLQDEFDVVVDCLDGMLERIVTFY
jgi:hypothetical protein